MISEKRFSLNFRSRVKDLFRLLNLQMCSSEPSIADFGLLEIGSERVTFCELKVLKRGRIVFQPGQPSWLDSWNRSGGVSIILTLLSSGVGAKVLVSDGSLAYTLSLESLPPGDSPRARRLGRVIDFSPKTFPGEFLEFTRYRHHLRSEALLRNSSLGLEESG